MTSLVARRGRHALPALLLLLLPSLVLAAWPTVNTDVVVVDGRPEEAGPPQAVPDGAGGAIVVWLQEQEGDPTTDDLWARRIDRNGDLVWAGPVRVVAIPADGNVGQFHVAPDGEGGALVTMSVYEPRLGKWRVRAQRLGADGIQAWGGAGTVVAITPDTNNLTWPSVVASGSGDVVVTWLDDRAGGSLGRDVYAQRLDADGIRQWGDGGVVVASVAGNQYANTQVADGAGGVFCVWMDDAGGVPSAYAQHVRADGTTDPAWAPQGELLTGSTWVHGLAVAVDGGTLGGFLLAFQDADVSPPEVRVMRLAENGDTRWDYAMGVETASIYGNQIDMVSDGRGGAFVGWKDLRGAYVQRMSPTGLQLWTAGGVGAAPGHGAQENVRLAADGFGGVFAVWADWRDGYPRYFAQRISSTGARYWDTTGRRLSELPDYARRAAVVADGRGGMIGVFDGDLYTGQTDILAHRIGPWGYPGDAAPRLTGVVDVPGDQGGVVRLDWGASHLDSFDPDVVDDYTIWRRSGGAKAASAAVPSVDVTALAAATGLAPDLVAAQLAAGWSYVGDSPAVQFGTYSYEAPTYADSTGAGEAPTEFKVLARDGSTRYWESPPLAGISVDNVAPGAPVALAAFLQGADGVLNWQAAGHDDQDLQLYEIHRATTPGFTPGPATLAGTAIGTTWTDFGLAVGPWYYVVAGRDVHGNLGAHSNEAILMGIAAVGGETPAAFTVAGAHPNPFNPRTQVRFALPAAGRAVVEVFDPRGRLVRRLHEGPLAAGWHEVAWDGRDAAGRAVPSGVYLARVRADGAAGTTKLLLAK